jgi:microcystin degradation protein MlrC
MNASAIDPPGQNDAVAKTTPSRRAFLRTVTTAVGAAGAGRLGAANARSAAAPAAPPPTPGTKRVFVAGFSHETNTFHPVRTTAFNFPKTGDRPLPVWKDANLVVVPGVSAHPAGGGTIDGGACREAMDRVLNSLRAAMPVDALFLRLHGAMFAEGVGPAETVLVGEARAIVGPSIPIACTFDLHGNIPARLAQFGDILVGLKTAPHTDGAQTAELAGRILLDTLRGKVRRGDLGGLVRLIIPRPSRKTMPDWSNSRTCVQLRTRQCRR